MKITIGSQYWVRNSKGENHIATVESVWTKRKDSKDVIWSVTIKLEDGREFYLPTKKFKRAVIAKV